MSGSRGIAASEAGLQLKVGLINCAGKYLTAETFGFKINASSTTFRKKQMWTIEPDANEADTVYVRSHLGRYMSGDKKGEATCSAERRGVNEKFTIIYAGDGSGRWAFCNRTTGYYLGGTDDMIRCYEKQPTETEWWWIHLAIHPQVNLCCAGRQKYVHLAADGSALQADELIPWGQDALIELEFREGRYCIKACDGRYLHTAGRLVDEADNDTMYTFEVKTIGQLSGLAFKDSTGKYLSAKGPKGVIQGQSRAIGKDELYTVEDSQPQVTFTAHNRKFVSIKQGIDVSANQDGEVTDKETFQLEPDRTGQWRIRTADNTYWSLEAACGIQAKGNATSPSGLFRIEYQSDGTIALRGSNGRYVTARPNGSLYSVSESPSTERELFCMVIINRPLLVLRCEYGFVGLKSANTPRYECNKTVYDVFFVESAGSAYYLKGTNGMYVFVDDDKGLVANSRDPQPFIFELGGNSRMTIKAPNELYVRGEQNGIVTASATDLQKATSWEY